MISKRLSSFKDSRLRIELLFVAFRLFLQRIAFLCGCDSRRVRFAFRSLLTRTVARRYICLFHKHWYLRFNTPTRKLRTKQSEKSPEYCIPRNYSPIIGKTFKDFKVFKVISGNKNYAASFLRWKPKSKLTEYGRKRVVWSRIALPLGGARGQNGDSTD